MGKETPVVNQPANFAEEVVGNQNSTASEASMAADQVDHPEQHPPTSGAEKDKAAKTQRRRSLPASFHQSRVQSEPPLPPPAETPPESPTSSRHATAEESEGLQKIKQQKNIKRELPEVPQVSQKAEPRTPPGRVKRDPEESLKRDAQSPVQSMNLKKPKVEKDNEQNRSPPPGGRDSGLRAFQGPETPPKPCRVHKRDVIWKELEEHITRGEYMFLAHDAGLVLGSTTAI